MRLIDAEAVKDAIAELNENGYDISPSDLAFVRNILLRMPTIDAVSVVRCKDCKFVDEPWTDKETGETYVFCRKQAFKERKLDWFCADGERSEDGEA